MGKILITAKVQKIIEGPLESLGFGVVQVRFIESSKPKLEILLERLDMSPLTVSDCARANRTISTHMDVEDIIHKAYFLEVSSAGIDRPLHGIKDYIRFINHKVVILTTTPIHEVKKLKGFIEQVAGDTIYFRSEKPLIDTLLELPINLIAKGNLDLDYMIDLKMRERKEQNEA